jgi:hypothetical protein
MNVNQTLYIINSTYFIKECPRCNREYNIYIYGTWLDVRASFDGKTDLPICATVNWIEKFNIGTIVNNEPSFGNFIYIPRDWSILYYPTGNIKQGEFKGYQIISVDGKPTMCCQKIGAMC